jgi:hypothetical protein
MKFSVISAFDEVAEQNPFRVRNMKYTMPYWVNLPDSEFVIIRQTKDMASKPMFSNTVNIYNPGTPNLGWAINTAAKHYTTGEFIIFSDADWVVNNEDFLYTLSRTTDLDVVNSNSELKRLTEEETQELVKNGKYDWSHFASNTRIGMGSPIIIRRTAFPQTGGFLELECWGIMDSAMSKVCIELTHFSQNSVGRAVHMYHDRPDRELKPRDKAYNDNIAYYEKFIKFHPTVLKKDAAERWKVCGNPGRYK